MAGGDSAPAMERLVARFSAPPLEVCGMRETTCRPELHLHRQYGRIPYEYRNGTTWFAVASGTLVEYLPSQRLPDEFDAVRRPTSLLQTDADVGW